MFPNDLIWAILIWLPVKSLMRFKCVSKFWLSIITNPSFAKDRRRRCDFPGLLISYPNEQALAQKTNFYYIRLDGDTSKLCHHQTVDHSSDKKMRCTGVINGLVCFYYRNYSYLYNVDTRESLQLPLSAHEDLDCNYYFGFDRVTKLYKLLKVYPFHDAAPEDLVPFHDPFNFDPEYITFLLELYERIERRMCHAPCEILTIGVDSSWRTIDYPPSEIKYRSVCIEGVLCWMEPTCHDNNQQLIAFDLAREKFLFVLPSENRKQFYLPRFSPTLALISLSYLNSGPMPDNRARIRYGYNNGIGTELILTWPSEEEVKLPPWKGYIPFLIGILPNEKLLIVDQTPNKSYPTPIYLYDSWKYERILLHVTPSLSSILEEGDISYHEENIMPMKFLNSST